MPPFGFQTAVRADAPRVADAMEFLNAAKETLAPLLPESVSQFGAAPIADGAPRRTRTRANLPRIDIPTGFAPRREFVGAGVATKPRRQNPMVGGCGYTRIVRG